MNHRHPAALEKLNDQKIFFLDGCAEWWDAQSDVDKIMKKEIDETIENSFQHFLFRQSHHHKQHLYESYPLIYYYSQYYLNEWRNKTDIDKILNGNNDIVFVMDLLKVNTLQFVKESGAVRLDLSQCRFPIVFKPSPVS